MRTRGAFAKHNQHGTGSDDVVTQFGAAVSHCCIEKNFDDTLSGHPYAGMVVFRQISTGICRRTYNTHVGIRVRFSEWKPSYGWKRTAAKWLSAYFGGEGTEDPCSNIGVTHDISGERRMIP